MARELPTVLAPLTGALAFVTCGAMVGLHLYGSSLPDRHAAEVVASVPVPPDAAWTLLSDLRRRPEWRGHVVSIAQAPVDGPTQVWIEQDRAGDHFDFAVVRNEPRTLVIATARPEDIGMYAEWTWTITPSDGGGSVITAREEGAVRNVLVRGWWSLRVGPYAGVEPDLRAFVSALGADPALVHRR